MRDRRYGGPHTAIGSAVGEIDVVAVEMGALHEHHLVDVPGLRSHSSSGSSTGSGSRLCTRPVISSSSATFMV